MAAAPGIAPQPAPAPDFWDNYQPVQHQIQPANPNQGVEVDDLYGPQPGGRRRRSSKRVKGRKSRKSRKSRRSRRSRR